MQTPKESLFEEELKNIHATLEHKLSPRLGANLRKNFQTLRELSLLSKIEMEGFLAPVSLVSLSDVDFERVREKIRLLLSENSKAAKEQGLDVNSW